MSDDTDGSIPDQERRDAVEAQSDPGAEVSPVIDEETGEDLGEVAGGGEITDLGGDSPSS